MESIGSLLGVIRLDQVAIAGLLTLAILMILTGRLVPRRAVDDWRDAYLKSEEANGELRKQNSALIEASKTTTRVVKALPDVGGGDSS